MSLPSWPGASVVYDRALRMLEYMSRDAHTAFRNRKNPRKRDQYHVPDVVREGIAALDRGDEEAIKAFVGNPQHDRYFKEALEAERPTIGPHTPGAYFCAECGAWLLEGGVVHNEGEHVQ